MDAHLLRRQLLLILPPPLQGYKFMFDDKLVTVWSAPNYCYRCGNVASILEVDDHLNNTFKTFEAAPTSHREEPGRERKLDYFL